jgi:sporadic carbohydrate cluster protein (TIGR04323 family)
MDEAGQGGDGRGYRGYITSRPVNGVAYPHKIQNLVVRDYCRRKGLVFLLSATEGSIPGSFMMLNGVLDQLAAVRGIVLFSQFLLPPARVERQKIYDLVLAAGVELHAAFEENVVTTAADIAAFDAPLAIAPWLQATPFAGRFPLETSAADFGLS